MHLQNKGKIFFASDFHLGLPSVTPPVEREKKVVSWLNAIAPEAKEIYLLGDIFDFWWEYRLVIPRGFTRFLGALSSITDSGIPVHFFTGNHDMWIGDYLSDECGLTVHTGPLIAVFDNKKFYLAHGEGLGTRNPFYKILLSIFHNRFLRVLYSSIHPSIGVGIGHKWSINSRLGKDHAREFLGEENEDLIRYVRAFLEKDNIDYFIFGHRHLELKYTLQEGVEIVFLGDWIKKGSFAEWDGSVLNLRKLS
jgi:UDP-2,3-diacylglucosamine hydrolase